MIKNELHQPNANLARFVDRLCDYLPAPAVLHAYNQLSRLQPMPAALRRPCSQRCPGLEPNRPVGGRGSRRSRLVILGEAPGGEEDRLGYPFTGPSGLVLTAALKSLGVDRRQVYITNTVRCRPPGNRTPNQTEQETCAGLLRDELSRLPAGLVVLTLGNVPLQFMRGARTPGVTGCRGRLLDTFRWQQRGPVRAVIPTFHPSYVLRRLNRAIMDQFVRDLREALGLALALRWPAFSSTYPDGGRAGSTSSTVLGR